MPRFLPTRRALLGAALLAVPLGLILALRPGLLQAQEPPQDLPAGGAPQAEAHATPAAATGDAAHGGHPEKDTGVYISQTIWALASFLLVLFVLLKKLFPPIIQAMDKRAAEIRSGLEAAERAREEAKEMMARHEASLEEARREAAAIIEEGKADALRVKDSIVESARKESEEIAARTRREIEQAKVAAIDDLDRRAVGLALDLTRTLIQKSLSAEEHQDLIQQRIRSLKSA